MPDCPSPPPLRRAGFTLVEVLVAMAVLILIVTLIVQLMNNATTVTTISNKHLASDAAAQSVFNIIGNDFDGMLTRTDVDYLFYKNAGTNAANPGNDSMWFYSNAPGYFSGGGSNTATSESPITLVGYRIPSINNRPDSQGTTDGMHPNFVLERVGRPFQWTGGFSMLFLTAPAPTPTTTTTSPAPTPTPDPNTTFGRYEGANSTIGVVPYTDGDWRSSAPSPSHIISPECFRMEFCYLLKSGSYYLPTATPNPSDPYQQHRIGVDVAAVVVGFAFLDLDSRKNMSPTALPGIMGKAAAALPDITAADLSASPPKLMEQKWNDVINAPGSTFLQTSGLPKTAAGQVRIYQRTFRIPTK